MLNRRRVTHVYDIIISLSNTDVRTFGLHRTLHTMVSHNDLVI